MAAIFTWKEIYNQNGPKELEVSTIAEIQGGVTTSVVAKTNGIWLHGGDKKGKENVVADALSRREEETMEDLKCSAISFVEPTWLEGGKEMIKVSDYFCWIGEESS